MSTMQPGDPGGPPTSIDVGSPAPAADDGRSSRPWHRNAATERAGNVAAILVNAALLVAARNLLDWDILPFLTDDFDRVLPAITLSLLVTIAVHVVRLFHDSMRFAIATDAIATGFGLYAAIRLFQVFPFDFDSAGFRWHLLVRALLVVAIVGSTITIVAAPFRLLVGQERTP